MALSRAIIRALAAELKVFFIDFPFTTIRFARGDDTDDIFSSIKPAGMRYQQQQPVNGPKRLPSFLSIHDPVANRATEWIFEHFHRQFEGDAVLGLISSVFGLIPF